MDKQAAAVDMPQKIVTQTCAVGSALNNTGNVRHYEGHTLVNINHAQIGVQGGKVVVGDFRTGIGGDGQQGGFAHVGKTYKAYVCQQLQLQNHVPFLTGQTCLGKTGHLTGGGGIVGIAPAAATALGDNKVLTGGHIYNDLVCFCVTDHSASGHLNDQRLSPLAAHAAALSVSA